MQKKLRQPRNQNFLLQDDIPLSNSSLTVRICGVAATVP